MINFKLYILSGVLVCVGCASGCVGRAAKASVQARGSPLPFSVRQRAAAMVCRSCVLIGEFDRLV